MGIIDEFRKSSECESEHEEGIELKSTISMLNSLIDDYKKFEEKNLEGGDVNE